MVFGHNWWFSGAKSSIRAKVVLFGKKWLYSGKVIVFGQKWLFLGNVVVFGKVVLFGQNGVSRTKWWYSGKSCCIRAKVAVFGQK